MTGHEKLMFTSSDKKARLISFQEDFYANLECKLMTIAPQAVQRL
jgi:hypothetical protein